MRSVWLFLVVLAWVSSRRGAAADEPSLEEAHRLGQQAVELYQAGRYQEALPLQQRALEINEKVLGSEHPDIVTGLNNLAGIYRGFGGHRPGPATLPAGPEDPAKGPEREHPDTATTLNNLAALYWAMAAYDQALPLDQWASAIREKVLGPEHADTSVSLHNLATLYQSKGDLRPGPAPVGAGVSHPGRSTGTGTIPTTPPVSATWPGCIRPRGLCQGAAPIRAGLQIAEEALGPEHLAHPPSASTIWPCSTGVWGLMNQALPLYEGARHPGRSPGAGTTPLRHQRRRPHRAVPGHGGLWAALPLFRAGSAT